MLRILDFIHCSLIGDCKLLIENFIEFMVLGIYLYNID